MSRCALPAVLILLIAPFVVGQTANAIPDQNDDVGAWVDAYTDGTGLEPGTVGSEAGTAAVPFKQIVIAAGDGSRAALGAFDYLIRS